MAMPCRELYEWHHQPRLPAILREAEALFVAPQMQVLPGAPLSPPMLNEASETVGSYRLPDKFLDNVYLPESTTIRVQSPTVAHTSVPGQPVGALLGLASITNTIIDTSAELYGYSVVLDADSRAISHLRGDELVIVEISIKVVAGKIGIMWTDKNYQPFASTERYASVMRGVQRI